MSHQVFFHNHRFASDCQELLSCCWCQLLVMFVFNVHYCYCYQYHTPNGVQHHCHDRHFHSCHFHSCRSSDPHFPPSYLLKHHLHMATATFMLMAQSFASSSNKTALASTLQCCAYHVNCCWMTSSPLPLYGRCGLKMSGSLLFLCRCCSTHWMAGNNVVYEKK